jgi:hypothetical protein
VVNHSGLTASLRTPTAGVLAGTLTSGLSSPTAGVLAGTLTSGSTFEVVEDTTIQRNNDNTGSFEVDDGYGNLPLGDSTPLVTPGCISDVIWPEDLLSIVRKTLDIPIRKPRTPDFKFEMTMEAAEKNFLLLMHKYGGSMELELKAEQDSPMGMGSEFRSIESLRSIYGSHPLWNQMVPILLHGSKWPLEPIS